MRQYIISLDQGTSSSRAVLFDDQANIVDITQREFAQHFPKPGWVEHDPLEIWDCQLGVLTELLAKHKLSGKDIAAIGITNQRETTVLWDKRTGKPIYNAIVWQDKRTRDTCSALIDDDWEPIVREKTGLLIDAYFSGTKIKWVLDNVDGARELAQEGHLLFGTIDTWLVWNLTQGEVHATDCSNASRTMLFNINSAQWDDDLLGALDIPATILPTVKDSNAHFGDYKIGDIKVPIMGVLGDQQAALYGQLSWRKGEAKNTYGTGCFMLLNTGDERVVSDSGLLTTIAWRINNEVIYALEGSVFIAGSAVQWLRDALQIIDSAQETEELANAADDDDHVVVVPAFAGLGSPYWDMSARGAVFGLSLGSGKAELARGTLQSIAFQTHDVLTVMQKDSGIQLQTLKVDGGAIANNYLAQFQADILNMTIERPHNLESTATGAAYMAGLSVGFWTEDFIKQQYEIECDFVSGMPEEQRLTHINRWKKAIERTRGWLDV
ncbi:MAG: glycerol kinase [Cycloclasticus sp. symbiont of Bathymodiolus heckerae]|nr:MAG: glycerol kinase [Cycloclasticus sp. symbiont of Bathymodiolus heckerae]